MVVKTSHKDHEPQLPVAQLTILSICRFAEPVALTSVFPYLPEMIESFGVHHNDVARWAGILSAIFSVSQCLTAIPWGQASDKYGRKPIILLAMASAMVSSLLFGFSKSLTWAIAARALSGASNGNVGILRTTVAEMVPHKSLQPKAFAVLPLIWQLGSIVGPIIGGLLANPAAKLPGWFGKNAFFLEYPFALPNLINGVVFTCGLLIGFLFLKESLESKKYKRDYGRVLGFHLTQPFTGRRATRPNYDDYDSLSSVKTSRPITTRTNYAAIFHPQANLLLLCYALLAFHAISFDQLVPVLMHLPTSPTPPLLPFHFTGGMSLPSSRIGLLFTLYGLLSLVAQFSLFPPLTTRYGTLTCFRACTALVPFLYLATPYTVLFPSPLSQQAALLTIMALKAITNVFAYPCITILLTNSAPSLALLATLNGIATSVAAVGRAVGPYSAGSLFSYGVSRGYMGWAWWLLAAVAVLGHAGTWFLSEGSGFVGMVGELGVQEELGESGGLEELGKEPGEELVMRSRLGKSSMRPVAEMRGLWEKEGEDEELVGSEDEELVGSEDEDDVEDDRPLLGR